MFLATDAVLSTLVIAVLSVFLHQSSGSSSRTSLSGSDAGVKCVESAPQYSTTNLDFMNVDISTKKMMDTAENIHCDCDWTTILEFLKSLL